MTIQRVLTDISGYALPAYTFTRSSSGYQIDSDGVLRLKSTDQLRIDYLDLDNDGQRETPSIVQEAGSTNKFTQSRVFSHSTWVKSAATVEADLAAAADLSTGGDLLVPSTVSTLHSVRQDVSLAASTDHALSVYASPGGYSFLTLRLLNSSGNNGAAAHFALSSSGTVVDSTTLGTGIHRRSRIDRIRPGVYRCALVGSVSTSTGVEGYFYVAQTSSQMLASWVGAGSSGALGVLLWGGQIEEAMPAETSLMASVATSTSRAAETLYIPFPYTPRPMTVYVRMREDDAVGLAGQPYILDITSAGNGSPRLELYRNATDGYTAIHNNGTVAVTSAVTPPSSPTYSVVELRIELHPDGSVRVGFAVDAGAETLGAQSAGAALAAAWAAQRLYLGSAGGTAPGNARFLKVAVAEDVQSMAYMRSLAPFFVIDGIAIPVAEGSVREEVLEVGDRDRTFDGSLRETIRSRVSIWKAETVPLSVGDRNRAVTALQRSTQPSQVYGAMCRTSTGLLPAVFTRVGEEALVQSSTERRYAISFTAEQSS